MNKKIPQELKIGQIKKLRELFKKNGVISAYQFGSIIEKNSPKNELSDYDFAIYFDDRKKYKTIFGRQVKMMNDISKILNFPQVDAIDLNKADPIIRHQAVFNGRNIYTINKNKKIALEHRIVQDYEDIKPLNNEANKILKKFVLSGKIGKPMFYQKIN